MPRTPLTTVFSIISALTFLYSLACIVRIIITWIPRLSYSRAAQILSRICDPYLNLFRNIRWLKLGMLDFSPILALSILNTVNSIARSISSSGYFSIPLLIVIIIESIWSIISSILLFILILVALRLVMLKLHRNSYPNQFESMFDSSAKPLLYKIFSKFSRSGAMEYSTALIITIVACALILLLGGTLLIPSLANLILFKL